MSAPDKASLLKILASTPEFKPIEVEVAEEVIDSYLAQGTESGYNIQVAEDEGQVLGYVCFGETPCTTGTFDIYWIAVDKTKRGHSIGKTLSSVAEKTIKEAGGRLIIIETSSVPLYENTRKFYLARGYEVIARIPDFYSVGDDKIILQKKLI
jgi:ribosomal protein S18 acetylase RimI-like enzyme